MAAQILDGSAVASCGRSRGGSGYPGRSPPRAAFMLGSLLTW
jgi:hypothetical protein